MKNIKRLLSAMLVLVLAFSFAGCHKKDEIAVTVGEWKFTSAYYMCAFLQANDEAQALVYQNLSDEDKQNADLDYTKQKVEGKKYETWVKDRAVERITEIAALKTICKDNKITIDEETKETYSDLLDSVWEDTQYGYYYASYYFGDQLAYGSSLALKYEQNGVAKSTYLSFVIDNLLSDKYFEFLYAEDGTREIPMADVEKEFYDNNILANVLYTQYDTDATDDEKKEFKEKLDKYVEALEDGKMTFEEVYNDYNEIEEEEKDTSEDESKEETDEHEDHDHEETLEPKDSLATQLTSEDDYYDTIKKMKTGEVKLIEDEDTGYVLVVKKDIKKDDYYIKTNDMDVRYTLKGEEFSKEITDFANTLKPEVDDFATGQFKVKNIK